MPALSACAATTTGAGSSTTSTAAALPAPSPANDAGPLDLLLQAAAHHHHTGNIGSTSYSSIDVIATSTAAATATAAAVLPTSTTTPAISVTPATTLTSHLHRRPSGDGDDHLGLVNAVLAGMAPSARSELGITCHPSPTPHGVEDDDMISDDDDDSTTSEPRHSISLVQFMPFHPPLDSAGIVADELELEHEAAARARWHTSASATTATAAATTAPHQSVSHAALASAGAFHSTAQVAWHESGFHTPSYASTGGHVGTGTSASCSFAGSTIRVQQQDGANMHIPVQHLVESTAKVLLDNLVRPVSDVDPQHADPGHDPMSLRGMLSTIQALASPIVVLPDDAVSAFTRTALDDDDDDDDGAAAGVLNVAAPAAAASAASPPRSGTPSTTGSKWESAASISSDTADDCSMPPELEPEQPAHPPGGSWPSITLDAPHNTGLSPRALAVAHGYAARVARSAYRAAMQHAIRHISAQQQAGAAALAKSGVKRKRVVPDGGEAAPAALTQDANV